MSRKVALIGSPLRRRHSRVMHNAAFSHFEIDADYELRDIQTDQLAEFVTEARAPEWYGFQVTAPYKELIVSHLDAVEEAAEEIGAVNSVVRENDGSLIGFNTDAPGFISAVQGAGVDLQGSRAVVVGAGGAARAVVWGLLKAGVSSVVIANRTIDRAADLASSLGYLGPVTVVSTGGADLGDALERCHIAVNATTVGMTTAGMSFDVAQLPSGAAVFDLVYVPPVTPLVEAAESRGLVVRNGLDMLVNQAQIAFERWTGIRGAGSVMRDSLDDWEGAESGEA